MATGIFGHLFGGRAPALLVAAALLLGGPGLGPEAFAAPPAASARAEAPAAGRVKIDVMAVYANNSGQVDPRLRGLQQQLEMMRFTGFQLLSTHTDTIGPNQTANFQVEGDRKIQVTLLSRTDDNARVRIEVFKDNEKKADTTVTIARGRTMPIGVGKYQDGSLILPVSVSY